MDTAQIEKIIAPILRVEQMELVDINIGNYGPKVIIQLFIDRLEGRISIGDCERLSDKIGAMLDMENAVNGPYVLEISSPGMDRVLKKEEHFTRFKGQRVKIKLKIPREGNYILAGTLEGFENGNVKVLSGGAEIAVPLSDIKETRLDPEINI